MRGMLYHISMKDPVFFGTCPKAYDPVYGKKRIVSE